MGKQEEIREWAKTFLQGVAHSGYYDDLEVTMLNELHSQGVVIKVERELPQITVDYVRALQGGIIYRCMKSGIEDIEDLTAKVYEELPQVICDVVNSALASYTATEPLIDTKIIAELENGEKADMTPEHIERLDE